jgi:hypothetical protein
VELPQLESLSRRIRAVQADLLLHEQQKRTMEPSEATVAQVDELEAMEGRHALQVRETPKLLQALHQGQATHQGQADALSRLSTLAQQSVAVATMLAADQEGLTSMMGSFDDNMKVLAPTLSTPFFDSSSFLLLTFYLWLGNGGEHDGTRRQTRRNSPALLREWRRERTRREQRGEQGSLQPPGPQIVE